MGEPNFGDELDEIFSLVGDQTRLEILRTLWEVHTVDRDSGGEPVPFSTLREAVGVRDSGRFNYHLGKLTPYFVRSTDTGYTLTHSGAQVIGAAVSGIYTETDVELESITMGSCPHSECKGSVKAQYETRTVAIECDTCDITTEISAPPILVGSHDIEDDPDALAKFALTVIQKTIRGFCHVCNGPVERRVAPDSLEADGERVTVAHECQECGSVSHTSAITMLVDHPGVISLFHSAGIDYRYALLWKEPRTFDWVETVRDDGSIEVTITLADEDTELRVEMDDRLEVQKYTRQ